MHLYVKHATLINNCYPEKEEGSSRSSELSYLTFYASTRPIKLTKVGLFLEKKVERDTFKGRKKHNVVTLEILQSLITACHRDLNLFSKHIVKILTMVLGMKDKDIELINKACETFDEFSKYHDGNTLGVEAEFTADYELIMQQFASYCSVQGGDKTRASWLKLMGHRGLQACVASPALQSANFKTQLEIIMPPVIVALAKSRQSVNVLAKSSKKVPDLKQLDLGSDQIDESIVSLYAVRTTSLLFGKVNGTGIRLALGPLLDYLDDKQKWWPPAFAMASIELVLYSLQVQYRYHLVNELLQQIENSTYQIITSKLVSLVSILDVVLDTNLPLTGVSVLEVLNSLFGHLVKSLRRGREFKMDEPSIFEGEQATFEYVVHQGLAHSMAGLATHTYYHNQLDDITSYFLAKLLVDTKMELVEGLPLVKYRDAILKCLSFIVNTDKRSSIETSYSDDITSSSSGTTISLETWTPTLGLVVDSEPKTRASFAMTLVQYLQVTAPNNLNVDSFPKHTLNRHGDAMFVNSLQKYMLQLATLDGSYIEDFQTLYHLLCALTRRLGVDGTIKTMPLVFQLQKLVEHRYIGQSAKERALATVIVEYFDMVGQFYHVDGLVHYINQVRTERLQKKEYSTVNFNSNLPKNNLSDERTFDDLEPENHNPVNIFVDRTVVVEILVKQSSLRDEEDIYGLNLESKLFVEWGSEAFANQDRSCRIRISRNLEDIKPRLATPWINMDSAQSTKNTKLTVKVENLKDALVTNTLETEETETYRNDLDELSTLASNCLMKRNKNTHADLSSLLSGLNLSFTQPASLINPPYHF